MRSNILHTRAWAERARVRGVSVVIYIVKCTSCPKRHTTMNYDVHIRVREEHENLHGSM